MCLTNIHFGLKVVPIWVLRGQSIYCSGTWTLRESIPRNSAQFMNSVAHQGTLLPVLFVFCAFFGVVPVLKPGSRNKGTLISKGLLENQVKEPILTGCRPEEPRQIAPPNPQKPSTLSSSKGQVLLTTGTYQG